MSGAKGHAVTTQCDLFAREYLQEIDLDVSASSELGSFPNARPHSQQSRALGAHFESCADCQADYAKYHRIASAVAVLGVPGQRRSDHVARVLAKANTEPSKALVAMRRARRVAKIS